MYFQGAHQHFSNILKWHCQYIWNVFSSVSSFAMSSYEFVVFRQTSTKRVWKNVHRDMQSLISESPLGVRIHISIFIQHNIHINTHINIKSIRELSSFPFAFCVVYLFHFRLNENKLKKYIWFSIESASAHNRNYEWMNEKLQRNFFSSRKFVCLFENCRFATQSAHSYIHPGLFMSELPTQI